MKKLYETTEELADSSVDESVSSTEETAKDNTTTEEPSENPDAGKDNPDTPAEEEPKIDCDGFDINSLTTNYMFGIDLVDQQGNPFPRTLIASYLNAAIAWAEQLFDICLTEQVITQEFHDYEMSDYMNWGYIQLFKRPVKEVTELSLMYGEQKSFEVPLEWLKLDKMAGKVQMFPAQGSANNLIISQGGVVFGLQQRWSYAPQMWSTNYVAGMDAKDIPENLKVIIYKKAAIDVFTVWGDLIIGAGIANQSISIDGMSQSIGRVNLLLLQSA